MRRVGIACMRAWVPRCLELQRCRATTTHNPDLPGLPPLPEPSVSQGYADVRIRTQSYTKKTWTPYLVCLPGCRSLVHELRRLSHHGRGWDGGLAASGGPGRRRWRQSRRRGGSRNGGWRLLLLLLQSLRLKPCRRLHLQVAQWAAPGCGRGGGEQ